MPRVNVRGAIRGWSQILNGKLVLVSTDSEYNDNQTVVPFTVRASVQPTKERELQALDLDLAEQYITLHIIPGGLTETVGNAPGRSYITYQGADYRVVSTKDWREFGGYFKAICVEARETVE